MVEDWIVIGVHHIRLGSEDVGGGRIFPTNHGYPRMSPGESGDNYRETYCGETLSLRRFGFMFGWRARLTNS